MGPPAGPRTYGSVESLAKLRSLPDATSSIAISNASAAVSQGPSAPGAGTERRSGLWFKLLVVCGLSLGAVVSVKYAGNTASPAAGGYAPEKSLAEFGAVTPEDQGEEHRPGVAASTQPAPLSFTATNYYHLRDGKPGQDYPWLRDVKLIEPYRETTLSVANSRKGFTYRWQIREGGVADEVHTTARGTEAVVILTQLDENLLTLEEVDEDGEVVRRLDEVVMVKYVRREIRNLTDDEREELLDAMFKLWAVRVQDGDGREIYGDGYSDIWAINRLHYKAASPQVCDHFHDGLGFLTNHALLSNTFEYSLQRVNPKLTLPYWDFTMESSSAGAKWNKEVDGVFESEIKTPLLQPSWFGTSDPEDSMVKDGRWAFTQIPRMKENNPSGIEPDVYSKLRAPWNVNRRAYLTRGMGQICQARAEEWYPWPTCEMHYDLATSYSDFYSWVWASLYDPHGPVHIWIGGVVDCADTYRGLSELVGRDTAKELAMLSFVHRKDMFRSGFFSCEGSVDVEEQEDEVFASGVCGCQGYDLTQGDDYLKIFKTMAFMEEFMAGFDDDTKRKLVAVLCSSTVNDGDHLQASSSLDPSFWPTHPTMERLWMFSVLTGQVTDFDWPESDVTYTDSDGTTYSESISIYSDDCVGHRGSDVFPFGLLDNDTNDFTVQTGIKGNPPGGGNVLSNRDALAAFDPRVNALPYVYDTFKWKHCEDDGFNMDDAWARGAESTARAAAGKPGSSYRAAGPPGSKAAAGGRTTFDKGAARYPMYGTLKSKMASLKAKKVEQEEEKAGA